MTNKQNALDDLWTFEEQRLSAEAEIAPLVARARAAGASWTEIGKVLGISKQAAQQRYPDWIKDAPLSSSVFDGLFQEPKA
jgi:hypothetical protein